MPDKRPNPEPQARPQIPYARQSIEAADVEATLAALQSDFLTQGPRVGWFEDALRSVTGAQHAVAVSSGTAALHLAALALGAKPGVVGIVPAITFAATANCLRYAGAEVTFCDVDPTSGLASARHFEAAFETASERGEPRLLLPVSFTGSVPELESIAQLAAARGLNVIEDAAHSIGGRYRDRDGKICRSGSCRHSDAAVMSFHPVKHICAGEGGAVLTNDAVLARRVRSLRSHGIERGEDWIYNQTELGYNYRLTDLQAALGSSQIARIEANLSRRRTIVAAYRKAFAAKPFRSRIRIASSDDLSAWHLFVIHFADSAERKAAYRYLHEHGVRVQVHYQPVYHHEYYKATQPAPLAGAEAYYETCLSLPLYPALTDEEQAYVIESIKSFLKEYRP